MRNIKLIVSYDGTRYNGWQKQANTKNTIQEKIEETISKFFGEEIEIAGSGRTDAGVHARKQVANFHVSDRALRRVIIESVSDRNIVKESDEKICNEISEMIRDELNKYLPLDIRIIEIAEEKERFHARLNAKGKHYSYTIDNGQVADVFSRKYMTRIEKKLDVEKMRQAVKYLIGEQDFKSFCSNKRMKKSTVRMIKNIVISENSGIIRVDFYGNGFLYNMIRIIMGTLIETGLGVREPAEMENVIKALDRSKAGFLAPASGLFLEEVYY